MKELEKAEPAKKLEERKKNRICVHIGQSNKIEYKFQAERLIL